MYSICVGTVFAYVCTVAISAQGHQLCLFKLTCLTKVSAFVDIMSHSSDSPPCRIARDDATWQWQPPPPSEVKGCPCSMDRNQLWPANPYTQAYNGTGLQFRKRLYILRGRSNSATPVGSVRYPRIKPPRMDPGWSAYLGRSNTRRHHFYRHF